MLYQGALASQSPIKKQRVNAKTGESTGKLSPRKQIFKVRITS